MSLSRINATPTIRLILRALSLLAFSYFVTATHAQEVDEITPLSFDYPPEVREVIEQRCVVCHGCYDAPCQLKMDAYAGFARGANSEKVYDGTRLLPAQLTRLYEDGLTQKEWREKGFFSVTNSNDPGSGVMRQMLDLKAEHPLPTDGPLPESFDLRLDRDQSCATPKTISEYREKKPYQGMPFGLPRLDSERLSLLHHWLDQGAPAVVAPAPTPAEQTAVVEWEAFFNGVSAREKLVSRYIFEHLFIASLYFDELPEHSGWYTLVRSRTPPGEPIELIATRRPYDDPGDGPMYYRLQQRHFTPLAKRHMPYALNESRMQRWHELFYEPDYEVATLPGYQGDESANPFITFEQLPVSSRYQFMLDEAHYTIMAYIKGPVCRGQVALNVIDDHFWVAFARPDIIDPSQSAAFLARNAHEMRLPQAKENLVVSLLQWRSYSKSQRRFIEASAEAAAKVIERGELQLDLDLIWNGGKEQNPSAALTVFRHFDSATVVQGFVGQKPKTMWIIDYSLLERIHYLLVAGFDVYGAVGHQLESRLYMDFLRMEGEQTFLLFLPEKDRLKVRDFWYRGARDHVREYLFPPETASYQRPTAIQYQTDDPKSEFMDMLIAHIPAANNQRYIFQEPQLQSLMQSPNASFRFLPEMAVVQVLGGRGERDYYSLVHNKAMKNNAQLFFEDDRWLPEEDTLSVAAGFVGAYPNMYFRVRDTELDKFVTAIKTLASEEDYTMLVDRFGVRRTATWFWKLSDDINEEYRTEFPNEAGLFDLNRYENR